MPLVTFSRLYFNYYLPIFSDFLRWSTHLSICHFFCPSICPAVHLSVAQHTSGTGNHLIIIFGTHVKWWYLQEFFHFLKFWIFGLLAGEQGKKQRKMKNNNYICHVWYLRNSIIYDHNFWYTCVKWWYLQVCFQFFEIFILQAVRELKGQKIAQHEK